MQFEVLINKADSASDPEYSLSIIRDDGTPRVTIPRLSKNELMVISTTISQQLLKELAENAKLIQ